MIGDHLALLDVLARAGERAACGPAKKIFRLIEGVGQSRTFYVAIPPRSSLPTGDDCGSVEMVATTSDGTEIARRGPFEECKLDTWVIQGLSGT